MKYVLISLLIVAKINPCSADVLLSKYYSYYRSVFIMWEDYKREHGVIDDHIKCNIKRYLMHENNPTAGRLMDELEQHNYDLETFEIKR